MVSLGRQNAREYSGELWILNPIIDNGQRRQAWMKYGEKGTDRLRQTAAYFGENPLASVWSTTGGRVFIVCSSWSYRGCWRRDRGVRGAVAELPYCKIYGTGTGRGNWPQHPCARLRFLPVLIARYGSTIIYTMYIICIGIAVVLAAEAPVFARAHRCCR